MFGPFLLYGPNDTAGHSGAAVAGGLGVKIVRHFVDEYRAADHFSGAEAVCVNDHHCGSVAGSEDRGKVAAVPGMGDVMGVIVFSGRGEGYIAVRCTDSLFMDVETEKAGFAHTYDPEQDQAPAAIGGEEDLACQGRVDRVAMKDSPRRGLWEGKHTVFHKCKTSFFYLYEVREFAVTVDGREELCYNGAISPRKWK